jgi:hypothetical protein
MDKKYCKDCKNRKDKKCAVVGQYVPRKQSCEKFSPKK